jgi:hypothetical protein
MTEYRRLKKLGIEKVTANPTALKSAGSLKEAYAYICAFLKLTENLKSAGIKTKADLDNLLAIWPILQQMDISTPAELKAYQACIWDLKGIKAA